MTGSIVLLLISTLSLIEPDKVFDWDVAEFEVGVAGFLASGSSFSRLGSWPPDQSLLQATDPYHCC